MDVMDYWCFWWLIGCGWGSKNSVLSNISLRMIPYDELSQPLIHKASLSASLSWYKNNIDYALAITNFLVHSKTGMLSTRVHERKIPISSDRFLYDCIRQNPQHGSHKLHFARRILSEMPPLNWHMSSRNLGVILFLSCFSLVSRFKLSFQSRLRNVLHNLTKYFPYPGYMSLRTWSWFQNPVTVRDFWFPAFIHGSNCHTVMRSVLFFCRPVHLVGNNTAQEDEQHKKETQHNKQQHIIHKWSQLARQPILFPTNELPTQATSIVTAKLQFATFITNYEWVWYTEGSIPIDGFSGQRPVQHFRCPRPGSQSRAGS